MKTVNLAFGILSLLAVAESPLGASEPVDAHAFFERKVRPLFVQHCYECHSLEKKKTKGGLSLDTREGLLKGGDSGPAVVPGDAGKSLLVRAVRHSDENLKMPPKQKLSDAQIDDLVAWVKMGAPDPRTDAATLPKYGMTLEEGRKFWSLRPLAKSLPPSVKDTSWVRTDVDAYILARLETAGLKPASPADRRTLLRRVTFDLTGLPPTPAEMDAFLADSSSNAFDKVVDRLLASPRYGERWGRHWLDVVRYADTSGNASDYPVPQAHLYRDWVIAAVQRDMPYDAFVRAQIAGDLLPARDEAQRQEQLIATGYLAISRRFGGSREGEHHLTLEDTIDNLGRSLLGFSLSCARCHDHKFDPFTMSDYYGLYGIFRSTRYPFPGAEAKKEQEDFVPLMAPAEIERLLKPYRDKIAVLDAEIKKLESAEATVKKLPESPDKKARLDAAAQSLAAAKKKRLDLQGEMPSIKTAYAVADDKAADAAMHLRGDPKRPGPAVARHFPAVLGGQTLPPEHKGSGRLMLAQWLTDPKNPLTARVMVNRIWQHHFGKGLVETPNDFGRQGKPPTHPELLDFLAARFIESGWSVKAMHRLILLSSTWQQASFRSSDAERIDPSNELLGRFTRQRLDAESIRDTLLFIAGELDEQPGAAHPFPPPHTWKFTQHNPFFAVYETKKRSVYLMQQRLRKHPYLALFDGADPSSSTPVRQPSTTPLQALFIMNDPLVHGAARKLALRLLAEVKSDEDRFQRAYQLAFNRPPQAEELAECAAFASAYRTKLVELRTPPDQVETLTWSAFTRALLSSNELIFVD
jgi:mono/diheme cytochrome c family protein